MHSAFSRYLLLFALTAMGVIGLAWIYVASVPMAFMESGYAAWRAKSDMLDRCDLGKLAFFGDSRLEASVIPAGLDADARNFGLPAGTMIETNAAVRRALRCPHLPAQAVVSLVADHLGPVSEFYWYLTLRYGFLTAAELRGAESEAARLGDRQVFSARTADSMGGWVRDWMYFLRFPSLSFGSLVKARIFGRYQTNEAHYREVIRNDGWTPYENTEARESPHPDVFVHTKLQDELFDQTIAALQARGVQVLYLLTPYRTDHPETQAYLDEFRRYLERAAAHFPGLALLDPQVPIYPDRYFADGAHLNPEGAKLFTERLAACISGGKLRSSCDLAWRDKRSAVLEMQQ